VDDVVELLPSLQISLPVRTFGLGQVEVDVAVADETFFKRPAEASNEATSPPVTADAA